MKILEAREMDVHIPFDMETFMGLAQVKGIEGRETVELVEFWSRWRPHLKVYTFGRKRGYLAAFMDRQVEDEIDRLWEESPSKGFKLQALVQTMIIGALRELIPQIGTSQCAPVPRPGKVLKKSLAKVGLELFDEGSLNYKYSTLTYYPFKDGCDTCYLLSSCPKINLPKLEGLFKAEQQ
ncbi:hypothetical protein [Desulfonatronovibrio hydrogenovorans]|uniref:hypothetical protein n=1 Tax=Desulfonatronovibrio hydrogenovorans TaxID=53245 RepID=UPI00068ADB73|nr:hypothetical protein [Desulfonatronovibrio hydrogenovorans]